MTNLIRAALLTLSVLVISGVSQAAQLKQPVPAPALTQTDPQAWLNSEPLSLQDLRGKVVLLDFWTFDCWNCYRSFPWLNGLEKTFADEDFTVLGIHTPEFDHEKVRENVAAKIKEFELHHPVMMDNDFAYWRAMGNRYWPAFYILDKQGRVRSIYIGETHVNTRQANAIEADIRRLLAES